MEELILTAEARTETGTRASRRMRDAGLIPAVLNEASTAHHLTLKLKDFTKVLKKGERVLDLKYSGGQVKVFLREVQYDHLADKIVHVDFTRIALDKRLTIEVPLLLKGKPAGALESNGVLDQYVKMLKISCLAINIPKQIEADVTHMKLNDHLQIKDIKAPEGVKLLQDPELAVAAVTVHEIEVAAPVAAEPGATEPEVIKKAVKEDVLVDEAGAKPPAAKEKEKEKPAKG